MDYIVTKKGLSRAVELAGGKPGYVVKIAYYKIGSNAGFQADDTLLDIQGAEMHRGVPIECIPVGDGRSQFTLFMDETVGTWQFGNIGLFLEDGTMYAIAAFKRPQWKIAFPDKDYNRVRLTLTSILSQGQAQVSLQANTLVLGALWEIPSPDDLPVAEDSLTNAYIAVKTDLNDNPALWVRRSKTWFSEVFPILAARGTVDETQPNSKGFSASALPASRMPVAGGAVVRFTSGSSAGLVRRLLTLENKVATWDKALSVQPGDSFELLTANPLLLATATPTTPNTSSEDLEFLAFIGI